MGRSGHTKSWITKVAVYFKCFYMQEFHSFDTIQCTMYQSLETMSEINL